MPDTIDHSADLIDSRDIAARIEELNAAVAAGTIDHEEADELLTLERLADEASGWATDWRYGVLLVRDDHFTEYAQQFAEDIGAIDSEARWPTYCIDWERAANDLKMDYTAVDFDGVTYWVQS